MNGEMNGTASFFILLPVVVPLVNLIFLFLPLYLCEEEKNNISANCIFNIWVF